jgi:stage III sporulation protein AA
MAANDEWAAEVMDCLPVLLRAFIMDKEYFKRREISEIRLRANAPLNIRLKNSDILYDGRADEKFVCSKEDLESFLRAALKNSYYAAENTLAEGYFTLKGGHRTGIGGRAVRCGDKITGYQPITSVNIRIAAHHKAGGDKIWRHLCDDDGFFVSTLVIGPPLSGKTTFLRSLLHVFSNGLCGVQPMQTGVADEKSEITGGLKNSGMRTDVLTNCPKSVAMLQLIRNMSPQLLITDEIGSYEDAAAIREAVRCGVRLAASAHGENLACAKKRPILAEIINGGFERAVELKFSGEIAAVYSLDENVQLL